LPASAPTAPCCAAAAGAAIIQQAVPVQQYPPDACPTLYAEGFPEDMTKRELAHVFRPYEGYKVGPGCCFPAVVQH
jgi:hypothetical protein